MNKKTKLGLALLMAFAAQGAMAGTEFNGYLRSGSGSTNKGGNLACFRLNQGSSLNQGSVTAAGRLGNECDTYGELALSSTSENDGTKWGVHTLLAIGTQQVADYEQTVPAFRESYASAQGFGDGALAKATVWVGKRYYNRKDVHIVDFFWLQVTGPGAGIENVDLGMGKFSYAIMRAGNAGYNQMGTVDTQTLGRVTVIGDASQQKTNHDFRLEGINLGSLGSLSFGTNIIRSNNSTIAGKDLNGYSTWITHSKVFGGVQNGLTLQTAKDAGSLDGGGLWWADNTMKKHTGWRVIDAANFEFGDNINGQAFLAYGKETFDWYSDGRTDTSLVIRPVYHFTEKFSLAVEAGRSQVKGATTDIAAGTNHLNKLTIAPQLSLGSGFYSRPVLRAYYTRASWNAGGASVCSGRDCAFGNIPAFAGTTSGSSYGVQMESWW
jgi:maltoporin